MKTSNVTGVNFKKDKFTEIAESKEKPQEKTYGQKMMEAKEKKKEYQKEITVKGKKEKAHNEVEIVKKSDSKPTKTVSQLWKEKTGMDWSKAKSMGLTSGSKDDNLALAKKLKSSSFVASLKKDSPKVASKSKSKEEDDEMEDSQEDTKKGMTMSDDERIDQLSDKERKEVGKEARKMSNLVGMKKPQKSYSDEDKNRITKTGEYIKNRAMGKSVEESDKMKKGMKDMTVDKLIKGHSKPYKEIEKYESPKVEKQELSAFKKLKKMESGEKMKSGAKCMDLSKYKKGMKIMKKK